MDYHTVYRKLMKALPCSTPEAGETPLNFLGMLSCSTAHRLRDVALSQSALVFVLQGTKTVIRGHERIQVNAGQGFLFPARMETTMENTPTPHNGLYVALCLTFDEATIARSIGDAHGNAEPHFLDGLRMDCDETIELALTHLLDMAAAAPDNERILSLCREALLTLVSEKTNLVPLLWRASSWGTRCGSVIGMEPGFGWTADSLATKLGTSERSLRRHLANEGTSLRTILREIRLNTGLALLQTQRLSVGEAAYRCGYHSASRFAALFKDRFGVHPSQVLRYNAEPRQDLAVS